MIIASASQFQVYWPWCQCPFTIVDSVLNSVVIVKSSFEALLSTAELTNISIPMMGMIRAAAAGEDYFNYSQLLVNCGESYNGQ